MITVTLDDIMNIVNPFTKLDTAKSQNGSLHIFPMFLSAAEVSSLKVNEVIFLLHK